MTAGASTSSNTKNSSLNRTLQVCDGTPFRSERCCPQLIAQSPRNIPSFPASHRLLQTVKQSSGSKIFPEVQQLRYGRLADGKLPCKIRAVCSHDRAGGKADILAASGILLILSSFVPTCDLRFTLRLLTSGLGRLFKNAC